jgi:hypothetical protein
VVRINQLYAVEHETKACNITERQQNSVPSLAALKPWINQFAVITLPKSPED